MQVVILMMNKPMQGIDEVASKYSNSTMCDAAFLTKKFAKIVDQNAFVNQDATMWNTA